MSKATWTLSQVSITTQVAVLMHRTQLYHFTHIQSPMQTTKNHTAIINYHSKIPLASRGADNWKEFWFKVLKPRLLGINCRTTEGLGPLRSWHLACLPVVLWFPGGQSVKFVPAWDWRIKMGFKIRGVDGLVRCSLNLQFMSIDLCLLIQHGRRGCN